MSAEPNAGSVPPGGNRETNVVFQTSGLSPGLRQSGLIVTTDTSYQFPDIPINSIVRFNDVLDTDPMAPFIYGAAGAGVMEGCGGFNFCPSSSTTRRDMAVWLLRAKEGASYEPPPATGIFEDVPTDWPETRFIEEIYRRGITAGCQANPLRYCPTAPVARGSMAVLLLATLEGSGYTPPPAEGRFVDVPALLAPWVEEIVRRGISAGCAVNPPRFCPDNSTTRGQMAVFIVSAFGLPYVP